MKLLTVVTPCYNEEENVRDLYEHARRIGTRLLFGGNLLRQPAYGAAPRRIVGDLERADQVMEKTFWVGAFPGLTEEMLDYVVTSLHAALKAAPVPP